MLQTKRNLEYVAQSDGCSSKEFSPEDGLCGSFGESVDAHIWDDVVDVNVVVTGSGLFRACRHETDVASGRCRIDI